MMDINCDRRSQCPLWGLTDDDEWVKVCVNRGVGTYGKYVYPNPMRCYTVICEQYGQRSEAEWQCDRGAKVSLGSAALPSTDRLGASPSLGAHPTSKQGAYRVHRKKGQMMDINCDRRSQCPLWGLTDDDEWVKVCVNRGVGTYGKYVYPNPMRCDTVICEQYGQRSEAEWQCDRGAKVSLGSVALPSIGRLGASPSLGAHPTSKQGAYRVHRKKGQMMDINCDRRSQCPLWGLTDDDEWVKVCVNRGV